MSVAVRPTQAHIMIVVSLFGFNLSINALFSLYVNNNISIYISIKPNTFKISPVPLYPFLNIIKIDA